MRAKLAIEEKLSSAQLVLFDKGGKERINVESGAEVPYLGGGRVHLTDENNHERIALWADGSSGGVLSLLNLQGAPGTILRMDGGELADLMVKKLRTTQVAIVGTEWDLIGKLDRDGLIVQGQGGKSVSVGVNAIGFADPGPTIRVALSPDGLQLNDAQGFETMLGVSDLVTQRTGETRKTSIASLVMLNKDKTVIWKAP